MKAVFNSRNRRRSFRMIDALLSRQRAGPGEAWCAFAGHRVLAFAGPISVVFWERCPFSVIREFRDDELGVEVIAARRSRDERALQPGDRGSVEPYLNCQHCYSCRCGHTNCCETNETLGVHCDGGLCNRDFSRYRPASCIRRAKLNYPNNWRWLKPSPSAATR